MKIEQFPRQKSSLGYLAAKYPTIIMYAITAILLFIPYVSYLAWLVPFVFFFREKDSKYLRLHAAQGGFLVLIFAVLSLLLTVIGDFVSFFAVRSLSDAAIIQAALVNETLAKITDTLHIVSLLVLILEAIFAYSYRLLYLPLLGKLATRLHDRTDPGPLR